jgi:hypothetical protein
MGPPCYFTHPWDPHVSFCVLLKITKHQFFIFCCNLTLEYKISFKDPKTCALFGYNILKHVYWCNFLLKIIITFVMKNDNYINIWNDLQKVIVIKLEIDHSR